MAKGNISGSDSLKLFNEFRDSVIVTDKSYQIRFANSAALRLFKITEKDLIGKNCCEFIYNSATLCKNCPLSETHFNSGGKVHIPPKRMDSRLFNIELLEFASSDGSENMLAHVFQLQSDAEKLEPTSYLRSIYSSAPFSIGIIKDGILFNLSSSITGLTGYSTEELESKEFKTLFDSLEEYLKVIQQLEVASAIKASYTLETQWKTKDGKLKDILLSLCTIDPGNPESGITFTALDISNHKLQDLKLRNLEEIIRKIQVGISGKVGEHFFETMVTELGKTLSADMVMIGEIDSGTRIHSLAVYNVGTISQNFSYNLEGTPCEQAIKGEFYTQVKGVADSFPSDLFLRKMAVEGYIGIPLFGSAESKCVGIMAALYKRPIKDVEMSEAILRIFSARAGTEIERKNTEKELAASEQKYRLLFNQMSSGFAYNKIILDAAGHGCDFQILESNPSFEKITGLSSSEINGKNATIVLPDLDPSIFRLCGKVAMGGKPSRFEYFHKSQGKHLEISVYSPERGYFAAIYTDISKRKKAEDNLKQERDFNALISHTSPVGIVYFNLDGKIIFANRLAEKMLSISTDPAGNESFASIDARIRDFNGDPFLPEQLPFNVVKTLGKSIYGVDISIERENGERTFLAVNASPIFTETGDFNGALATFDDISKEVLAEMELIRAKEKAIESDKLKTAFLANISHEIRTPMNGIMGFSSLLDNINLEHTKRQVYTNIIRERCRDLLHIVDDLLDLSKIESGYIDLFPTRFELNQMMNDLEMQYTQKLSLEAKTHVKLILEKSLTKGKDIITTDESRLRQVMCNLLDNAMKFTEEGFIHFGYGIVENEIQLFVEDSGIGVAEDKLNIIFERFRQAEETLSKNYGGAGLGLAISKSLVELMGGRIWVNSEPGKGSKFTFTLPVSSLASREFVRAVSEDESLFGLTDKKIMVVEDDEFSRLYMEELFTSQGMDCYYAASGTEALEIFHRKARLDLILMDIRLPDINGLEVTRIIKAENPGLPVIALTAYAMEDDKKRCMEAGCDDYISKPVFKEPLIEKINQFLKTAVY
jgi:PAS domain S-box-containing protein